MDSINNAACKFGSDAWLELQAFKTRQLNRREKLKRHKNIHQDLISDLARGQVVSCSGGGHESASSAGGAPLDFVDNKQQIAPLTTVEKTGVASSGHSSSSSCIDGTTLEPIQSADTNPVPSEATALSNIDLVECLLLLKLCDLAFKLPIDSKSLQLSICRRKGLEKTSRSVIENLLQKFALQELITIDEPIAGQPHLLTERRRNLTTCDHDKQFDEEPCIYVVGADHTRLIEFDKSIDCNSHIRALILESTTEESNQPAASTESCFHVDQSVPIQTVKSSEHRSLTSRVGLKLCNKDSDISKRHQQDSYCSLSLSPISNSHQNQNKNLTHAAASRQSDDLESLLLLSSTKERESKKLGEELLELLSKPTAKERNLIERFRSADGYQVQEFCPKGTKGECNRKNKEQGYCNKLHFKKIIAKHTEESLGDCSFLNTCFHMDSCKYVHYEVDYDDLPSSGEVSGHKFKKPQPVKPKKSVPTVDEANYHDIVDIRNSVSSNNSITDSGRSRSSLEDTGNHLNLAFDSKPNIKSLEYTSQNAQADLNKYVLSPEEQAQIEIKNRKRFKTVLYSPQWIQCDLRYFDMSLLGKFSVVMADPPWDIHMELPYGTMSDDEMRKLNIPALQDEGVIFLWVTGRAMELGRECLALWGYERSDEIIWVKTNQLQRIIRTGRTGHWLNHGKEHCLVGVKGNPKDINRGLDCDVIVAEVRATSHKPDEIYGIIERLSPGTRKIELFGRAHNVQPNWITLGNQLNGVQLIEPNLVNAFKKLNLPFQTVENISR